jgi:hypothetical protein
MDGYVELDWHGERQPAIEFDWAEIYRRLDSLSEPLPEPTREQWETVLGQLLRWLLGNVPCAPGLDRRLGRRVLAMLWVITPAELGGQSLRGLARESGVPIAPLTHLTADFSRQFGLVNGSQAHDWRRRREQQPATVSASQQR